MNNRSSSLSSPLLFGVVGLIIGLIIGWLLLGAISLSPLVTIKDTLPSDLKPEFKSSWVVSAADAYAVNQDLTTARDRLRWFTPDEVIQVLRFAFTERNTKGDSEGAARLATFGRLLGYQIDSSAGAPKPTPASPGTGTASTTGLFGGLGQLLLILAGVILLIALGLFLYMRMRGTGGAAASRPAARTAMQSDGAMGGTTSYARPEPVMAPTQNTGMYEQPSTTAPIATQTMPRGTMPLAKSLGTFAATYKFGEDNYDTSFTLETARGEFLGETGMGSSETIGEGKPDKVTAFDVWLFDKTDVRTVTQILMSDAAFNDQATRQRLATKGELVLAEKGKHVRLETATLAVDAEIVDLVYASTPGLAPNSHFQKLIVEMVPAQK